MSIRLVPVVACMALGIGLGGATAGVMIQRGVVGTPFTYVKLDCGRAGRVRLLTRVSSETSRVGDPVAAELMYAWLVEGQTVLPAGTRVQGHVTLAESRARRGHPANLVLRYDRVVLPEGGSLRISSRPLPFAPGVGTVAVGGGDAVVLPAGTGMLLKLIEPATVPVGRGRG